MNEKIGEYTIQDKFKKGNRYYLSLKCKCGTIVERRADYFKNPKAVTHCGCKKQKKRDQLVVGARFNRLVIIEPPTGTGTTLKAKCRCDCGVEREFFGYGLLNGDSGSCGCYNLDILSKREGENHPYYKHGDTKSKLYQVWFQAKSKGMCEEWLDYINFKNWAEKTYKEGLMFVKIDYSLPHSQTNSKFVTRQEHQTKEIIEKAIQSRVDSGNITLVDGKTLKDIAIEQDKGYTTLCQQIQKYGIDKALSLHKYETAIEQIVKQELDDISIDYTTQFTVGGKRADIAIPQHKLLIECDGIYWHSDRFVDKNYHVNKRTIYQDAGFRSLFFREDEINSKLPIVMSIITNACKKSIKIGARQCTIKAINKEIAQDFIQQYHLMGKGKGDSIGLYYNNLLVSVMQISKQKNGYEISRFCNRRNITVVGGISKILKYIERNYNPEFISTFIDLRYGDGQYLVKLGFNLVTCYPSFRWVGNNTKTYHRMKFPGDTGYDNGCFKLWDCGQAKYIRNY